ncbi:MAG: DNA-binding protein [Bacteroides sp.]|nr:DNA-binding protein [Bacteroides sp.]
MSKYIKQEMPDIHRNGEQKVYYRLKTERNIDTEEFIRSLHESFKGMNEADITRVMIATADHLSKLLGQGYSVTLNGIGTFKATIGLEKNKELDTLEPQTPQRNAQSIRMKGVNYRADKELIKKASKHCKLEREGIRRIHRSPYSKEERLELALQYLNEHGAMKVMNYVELTGLSRTVATLELKEFRQDPTSGIDFIGRGSAKVYVKKG